MELNLRPERADDFREAECVVREAFWNCCSPGGTEHYLLHVMRGARAFVPELSMVAECGGRYAEDATYEIDESAAEAFDSGFPSKEKIRGTRLQRRFDRLAALRRPARTNVFELNNE